MKRARNPQATSQTLNRIIFFALTLLVGAAGFGLGTIYLRHEAAKAANEIKRLEARAYQSKQRLADLGAQLSELTTQKSLRELNASFALGLAMPNDRQIVRVTENVEARLYQKTSKSLLTASNF